MNIPAFKSFEDTLISRALRAYAHQRAARHVYIEGRILFFDNRILA
jgi:hypothetical protein